MLLSLIKILLMNKKEMEEYAAILDTYKQVQEQGDGIKSFTGILLLFNVGLLLYIFNR